MQHGWRAPAPLVAGERLAEPRLTTSFSKMAGSVMLIGLTHIVERGEGWIMDGTVAGSIAVFAVILALLVVLRARDSKFEVRPTDIVVAILPIVIFLLVTGK